MSLTALSAAGVAGVLDGFAASVDTKAGRHWDTTGMSLTGGPIVEYGWAPAVQAGAIVVGLAAGMVGGRGGAMEDIGRGLTVAGTSMIARALAFKFAQRNAASPMPTQGYGTGSGNDNDEYGIATGADNDEFSLGGHGR